MLGNRISKLFIEHNKRLKLHTEMEIQSLFYDGLTAECLDVCK